MDTSAVTRDILDNPRYEGAIDSIGWLTDLVDYGFITVISFVAFFIISVAILKNVLAGCYVAFPKFWDKVDMAHKEVEGQGWITRVQDTFKAEGLKQINAGTLSKAAMRLLPNIKTYTDFDDDTVSAKSYFIRAIPQMLAVIIIGAFIYNGQYRDVAMEVVDFGSEMFSRVMLAADPVAVFDQITNYSGSPDFMTNNSVDASVQFKNKVVTSAYNTVIGTYHDVTSADAKATLAAELENWVLECLSGYEGYIGTAEWEGTIKSGLSLGEQDLSYIHEAQSADGLTYSIAFQRAISSLELPSNIRVGEDWYIRFQIQFKKQASVSSSTGRESTIRDLILNVNGNSLSSSDGNTLVNLGAAETSNGVGIATGSATKPAVFTDSAGNRYTVTSVSNGIITFSGSISPSSGPLTLAEGNLYYKFGTKSHNVTSIAFTSGSGVTLSSASGVVPTFNYVDGPNFNSESEESEESTAA